MVVTSAPGKILWIGGYSVLEKGNIAFVTGVDKRVYVQANKTDPIETSKQGKQSDRSERVESGSNIHIKIPQFDVDATGKFDGSKIDLDKELNEAQKKGSSFVRVAIETCLRYLKHKGHDVKGLEIESYSDQAFGIGDTKTGLGGSAAVTTSTVAAIFELHGLKIDENRELIHKMAQFIHYRAQGKIGSGFDIAAACFGGNTYSRYSPEMISHINENSSIEEISTAIEKQWDYTTENMPLPHGFLVSVGNFIDESASTSQMVKKINEWKAGSKEAYKTLMNEINEANKEAIRWLKEINNLYKDFPDSYEKILKEPSQEMHNFKKAFEKGRILTKHLGELTGAQIETNEVSQVIEQTMKHGAFTSKLPGAGGGDNIAAISLSKHDKHKVESYWLDCVIKQIEPLNISISNEGVKIETKTLEQIKADILR